MAAWVETNATPVTFAFLGAYFVSIQMLFRRYVRSDLRGSAYVVVVMRVVLALIAIWVLEEIVDAASWHPTQSQMLVLGFAIGVFPVVVWQIIRSMMIKICKYALPSPESQLALDGLDGLTVWHEARLEEEDSRTFRIWRPPMSWTFLSAPAFRPIVSWTGWISRSC